MNAFSLAVSNLLTPTDAPVPTKRCAVCEAEFVGHVSKLYCSPTCKETAKREAAQKLREYLREHDPEAYSRLLAGVRASKKGEYTAERFRKPKRKIKCVSCGVEFESAHPSAKVCSKPCRNRVSKLAERAKVKAEKDAHAALIASRLGARGKRGVYASR